MCEFCDVNKQVEKLHSELSFRFAQFQVELDAEREDEAAKCQDRAATIQKEIFTLLRRRASLDIMHEEEGGLKNMFSKMVN